MLSWVRRPAILDMYLSLMDQSALLQNIDSIVNYRLISIWTTKRINAMTQIAVPYTVKALVRTTIKCGKQMMGALRVHMNTCA